MCKFSVFGSQSSFRRRGFTLVEMAVVMSIIAVLMLLGVSALISARGQSVINSATDAAVVAIREAQSKSIAVSPSSNDNAGDVGVWGVKFDESDSLFLLSVDLEGNEFLEPGGTTDLMSGVKISDGIGRYVYFASPFGTPHLAEERCENWAVSERATRELEPHGCSIVEEEDITVVFTYRNHSGSVVINKRGDVSVN